MDDIAIIVARHDQIIKSLEQEIMNLKAVQMEIRTMNENLVTLATELKHTNEHLAKTEAKIENMEALPEKNRRQITTAMVASLSGALAAAAIGWLVA